MSKADKVATQVVAAGLRELSREIDEAHNNLFSDEARENPTLPEHLFVSNFLPFFAGKVKDDRKLNITTHWIAVAGTAMNSVDVVNDRGEKIYTVPPLMSTDFLHEPGQLRGKTFGRIFADAQLQAQRLPQLGQAAIAEGGAGRLKQMNPDTAPDAASQWSSILKRYSIAEPTNAAGTSLLKKPQSPDEELVFD